MRPYPELDGFADLYLEDSWVRDILARPGTLVVEAEIVLREDHPAFRPPREGDQYCYRRGRLVFVGVRRLEWHSDGLVPARDATGELDYGSIDFFGFEHSEFRLEGDFGTLDVSARSLTVEF